MNVHEHAHALVQALKVSPEYEHFKLVLEKLQEDSTARKMLIELRKIQWKMEKQKIAGLEPDPEDDEQFASLMELINLNMTMKEYLEGEYRFSIILNDIQRIIGEAMREILTPEMWEGEDG